MRFNHSASWSHKERDSTVFSACWLNVKHSLIAYETVRYPMKPLESWDWLNKTQWEFLPTSTHTDKKLQVMSTYKNETETSLKPVHEKSNN